MLIPKKFSAGKNCANLHPCAGTLFSTSEFVYPHINAGRKYRASRLSIPYTDSPQQADWDFCSDKTDY